MIDSSKTSFSVLKEKYFSDIRFWIVFFFIIRLYGITDAPLESAHNWRQCFTNSIARSFLQIDSNIFYPHSNIYGNSSGIVGTEFPIFSYLIFIVSKIFGYAHWYGRLINLIISSIGIFYFYKTVSSFINQKLAFVSAIILLCSLWFIFSRKSMPDTFSVSLVLVAIYYGISYLKSSKAFYLVLYFLFMLLGILSKIPAIYFYPLFVIFLFSKEIELKPKIIFSISSFVIVTIVFMWYFKWVPYLESIEGNRLYFPRTLSEGVVEVKDNIGGLFEKFYFASLQSFVAFAFFIVGLYYVFKVQKSKILIPFISLNIVFIFFIIKTGVVFPTHSYYILPYTPIMALIAGYGLVQIKNIKWIWIVLAVIVVESILNQQNDFRIKEKELALLRLEAIADKVVSKNDLVAVSDGDNPQMLYFINRKGWRLDNEKLENASFIETLREKGCKYLFINKNRLNLNLTICKYEIAYKDDDFVVYKL